MIELHQRPRSWPTSAARPATLTRRKLTEDGYVTTKTGANVAAMAAGLAATVPALLGDPTTTATFATLADTWAGSREDRADTIWSRRPPDDPRGPKVHLQVPMGLAQRVRQDRRAPALICHVLFRLEALAAEARRLLVDHLGDVDLRCTVRADVYDAGGTVPPHVDESAFTVVFTDRPGGLHVAAGRNHRAPADAGLRPVARAGWCAVLMAGEQAETVLPGLAATPHAAVADGAGRRLSVSVFAGPARR